MQMVAGLVAADAATVVLVDGENIPQSLAGQIIIKTPYFGPAMVRRIYGDMTRLPDWEKTPSFEAVHTNCAKNAADMRICIDALDLVHRGGVGRVVIVSSDSDFTQLAQNLRAKGVEVVGMGEGKTPARYRFACSWFIELIVVNEDAPVPASKPVAKPAPAAVAAPSNLDTPQKQIAALIKAEGKAGMLLTALSVQMGTQHGFRIGKHEKKTWRAYLSAQPALYQLDPKGTSARVRLKS